MKKNKVHSIFSSNKIYFIIWALISIVLTFVFSVFVHPVAGIFGPICALITTFIKELLDVFIFRKKFNWENAYSSSGGILFGFIIFVPFDLALVMG